MPHSHDRRFDPAKLARLDSPERRQRMPPDAIRAAAAPFADVRVADVGAGAGFCSFALLDAPSPPALIHAIDVARELLDVLEARREAHPHGRRLTTHCSVAESLPLPDGAVELVMLAAVLHELDDAPRALREAHRVLTPGGRVLIIDWDVPDPAVGEPPVGPPWADRISSRAAGHLLAQAGFRDLRSHGGFEQVYALTAAR
jgi:ubiquinone/menaquinone biosynthesis C-methylase UbiE